MSTVGKVLLGAGVLVGGYVIYKTITGAPPVSKYMSPPAKQPDVVSGFLGLATSLTTYFTKNPPQSATVPWSASTQYNPLSDFSNAPMGYSSSSVDENALFS